MAVNGQTGTGHNPRSAPTKIPSVVGARPKLMKIAPIVEALKEFPDLQHCLVHFGQHYDELLSGGFSPNSVCRGLT
jgi:UDP-N-acetylglucosamine 2-epimerase